MSEARLRRTTPPTTRFWRQVDKRGPDECWNWTAGVGSHGYGMLGMGRRGEGKILSHRYSYLLHHPVESIDGWFVMHSCDNRRCVNPHHLSLGSAADNLGPDLIVHADSANVLPKLPDASFRMIYIDPPFNTGKVQSRQVLKTTRDDSGSRVGFKGQTYSTVKGRITAYNDSFADYWEFLEPKLEQAWRLLTADGTLYLHLDFREVHYAKVLLDALFGRECFLNEIIWAYDYGARSKSKWPAKHDNILVYVKDPKAYFFNNEAVDREPYMAPGLVGPEKAARGKLPTDVWWHTIVSPTGKEKTGYATQKPEGIVRRMVQASTEEGDWVLDFFAGSGTLGAVAADLGRRFVVVDENPDAIEVMNARLSLRADRLGAPELRLLDGGRQPGRCGQ